MYGLKPDDIQHLAPLKDAVLIQICVGEHQLLFHFQPERTVSIESCCELLNESGALIDAWEGGKRSDRFQFLELLGRTAMEVVIDSPKSFKLRFSGGRSLRVIDNSEQFESFSVDGLFV